MFDDVVVVVVLLVEGADELVICADAPTATSVAAAARTVLSFMIELPWV